MLKNWWIIGAIPLIAVMSVSTVALFNQQDEPVDQRQFIRTAIGNFGSLKDRGIGQVEILSDTEVRFLLSGAAEDQALSTEAGDKNLKNFCNLLLKEASTAQKQIAKPVTYRLSYHHRQIAAIEGEYICKDAES